MVPKIYGIVPISAVWWPKYTACAKNVRHGAKNGWHGDKNVRHGAKIV